MEDNPFAGMVSALRGAPPPAGLVLGKVLCPKPLKLLAGGNTLEADRLLADPALLKGYRVPVWVEHKGLSGSNSGALSINASCAHGVHIGMDVMGGTLEAELVRYADAWETGDQVLLLPIEDAQRYVILCRVVAL